jgi:hypothetical protein
MPILFDGVADVAGNRGFPNGHDLLESNHDGGLN